MVAPTVRNGDGGVEGQTGVKNRNTFKGKCEGEMISGAHSEAGMLAELGSNGRPTTPPHTFL